MKHICLISQIIFAVLEKHLYVSFALFIMSCTSILAQESQLDSIDVLIGKNEFSKANNLLDSLESYFSLSDAHLLSFLSKKSKVLHHLGKYNQSIENGEKALELAKDTSFILKGYVYSNIIPSCMYMQDLKRAKVFFDKVFEEIDQIAQENPISIVQILKNYAVYQIYTGGLKPAVEATNQAILYYNRYDLNKPTVLGDILLNQGAFYMQGSEMDSAYILFHKAKKAYLKVFDEEARKLGSINLNLSILEKRRGNVSEGIILLAKAKKAYHSHYGGQHPRYLELLVNEANQFQEYGDYERALRSATQALQILEVNELDIPKYKIPALGVIANAYLGSGEIDKAKVAIFNQIRESANSSDSQNSYLMSARLKLFSIHKVKSEQQEIIDLFEKIRSDYSEKLNSLQHLFTAYFYAIEACEALGDKKRGNDYVKDLKELSNVNPQLNIDKRIEFIELRRQLTYKREDDKDLDFESLEKYYSGAYEMDNLLELKFLKSDYLFSQYEQNKSIKNFSKWKNIHFEILEIIKKKLKYLQSDQSKLIFANQINSYLEIAIDRAFKVYEQQKDHDLANFIYSTIQANRSILFKEKIKANQLILFDKIENSITQKWQSIEKNISEIRNALSEGDNSNYENNSLNLAKLYNSKDSLIEVLSTEHPEYYSMIYSYETIDLKDVQNKLTDIEGHITTFLGNEYLYVISISNDDFLIERYKDVDVIRSEIKAFHGSINKIEEHVYFEYIGSCISNSMQLFEKKGINDISIITDKVLSYVPFEALPYGPTQVVDLFSISYQWTPNFAVSNSKIEINDILSFAPLYQKSFENPGSTAMALRSEEMPLKGAGQEAEALDQMFDIKSLVGDQATEEAFYKFSNNSDLIHLSMHGYVNRENPLSSSMIFTPSADTLEDGLLKLYEVYNTNLNAHLVTLSSCNSGDGKLEDSEGVLSFARAFAHAGVSSSVMALYEIPDHSTSIIIKEFYSNLEKGMKKSIAMQQAKLTYRSNVLDPSLQNPLYWAGLVVIGDNSPLQFNVRAGVSQTLLVLMIVGLFLFSIGAYYIKKKYS